MRIEESKEIYMVITNSDLTEGRGATIILGYYHSQTTAIRKSSGRGVQGTHAQVNSASVHKIDGLWYGPVIIENATGEDKDKDRENSQIAVAKEKAMKAGLTEREIQLLSK